MKYLAVIEEKNRFYGIIFWSNPICNQMRHCLKCLILPFIFFA